MKGDTQIMNARNPNLNSYSAGQQRRPSCTEGAFRADSGPPGSGFCVAIMDETTGFAICFQEPETNSPYPFRELGQPARDSNSQFGGTWR